ncbi:MAG: cation-translocating P-type ATPase, partial [Ktedonobacteraceae bacterium]|nr:cation-translocating P-type ATPase [Ktedonobacteraceae bacterium]
MATKSTLSVQPQAQQAVGQECQAQLALEGMSCASCAMRIEKGLKKLPGVLDAQVNFATERASVTYDPVQTGIEQMIQKVEAVGYKAQSEPGAAAEGEPVAPLAADDEQRKQSELRRKRNLLILGIVLSLPIMVLSMFFVDAFPGENVLLLVLAAPVWAVVGWEFHRSAINALRHRAANMDTLVSLGSTAAYLLSVAATFWPGLVG